MWKFGEKLEIWKNFEIWKKEKLEIWTKNWKFGKKLEIRKDLGNSEKKLKLVAKIGTLGNMWKFG